MSGLLLVRGARQLLTLRGGTEPRRGPALRELGLIPDGALLIRDGLISSVGPSRRIENLAEARSAREIDASGKVVVPGFVDSHTHLVARAPRLASFGDAGDHGAVPRTTRAVPASRLLFETRRRLAALIRHGTTTVEIKSGGENLTEERKILRVLARLKQRPLDVVPTCVMGSRFPLEFVGKPDDYLQWMCAQFLPAIRRRGLARCVDVACRTQEETAFDARRCLQTAGSLGFRLKVHAEQSGRDGGARLAVEFGALSADHLNYATPEDVVLLAASSTIATLLPGSVYSAGGRLPPARALIDAGAAVALASGFEPAAASPFSMQAALALACYELGLTPAEALAAATINGAHALGLAHTVGSLEVGKQADLLILDAPDFREITYHFGGNLVAMTLKRGEILHRQGELRWPED